MDTNSRTRSSFNICVSSSLFSDSDATTDTDLRVRSPAYRTPKFLEDDTLEPTAHGWSVESNYPWNALERWEDGRSPHVPECNSILAWIHRPPRFRELAGDLHRRFYDGGGGVRIWIR
jgi:hypothetical protein